LGKEIRDGVSAAPHGSEPTGGIAAAVGVGAQHPLADRGDGSVPTRQEQEVSLHDMLLLLNRVIAAAVTSIVVTDPHLPDNPIVYHNPAFERVSGYAAHEIDGRNCRFLQGKDTDPEMIAEIRKAIAEERPCHVVLLNYRKDGTPFWNELSLSPVHDADGRLTHFVGVQNDVTMRKEAEAERDALLAQQQRIADTLQRALLLTPPTSAIYGLEIATQYEPAWDEAQFGGDFYDAFAIAEDRVALVIGDVTGKGLVAARHTAEVKYALRVLMREYGHPTPALHRLNNFLMDSQRLDGRERNALVCISVAVVNTETGDTDIAAAGMEPPLVIRSGGVPEIIEARGLLLGMDTGAEYTAQTLRLGEGDILVLATDGVTEARSQDRRFFGYEGLVEAARGAAERHANIEAMSESVVATAKAFAGGRPQDDVCLLLARRPGRPVRPGAGGSGGAVSESSERAEVRAVPTVGPGDAEPWDRMAAFAIEAAGLGYWDLDTLSGTITRSPRYDRIFGFDTPAAEWNYERFLSHVYPEDRAHVDARYGQALATGTDWRFECRIVRGGDSAVRWIEASGRHLPDETAGVSTRIVGTVADITDRKERMRRLEESEQRYRSLYDRNSDAVFSLSLEGDLVSANAVCERVLGYSADELRRSSLLSFVVREDQRRALRHFRRTVAGEPQDFEVTLRHRNGHYVVLSVTSVPKVVNKRTVGVYGMARDVTEEREAESGIRASATALRISEERYRLLTLATNQIVWWTGADGTMASPAPHWEAFTGQTEAEYCGWGWMDAIHPEDRTHAQSEWRAALESKSVYECGYRLRFRDGSYRHTIARAAPILDERGEIMEWIGANQDVTEQREAELRERLLADLSERTRLLLDPDAVVGETVGLVGPFLGLSRYLFADVDATGGTLTVHRDFVNPDHPGVSSAAGVWPLTYWAGEELEKLRAGRTVVHRDRPPSTAPAVGPNVRASVTVPLLREGRWVAVFSAQMCDVPRDWASDDVELLETVAQRMWLTIENARLRRGEQEAAKRHRAFLREMLFGLTEGRLRLCDTATDLPERMAPATEPVELNPASLRVLRRQVEQVARELHYEKDRIHDLETATHEAAMNAVRHAGGGTGRVHADPAAGVIQVWIEDQGEGIAEHLIHRAIERGWTTGGFGQGFWLMLKCADRVYLFTSPEGTTVVVEQDCVWPIPAWLKDGM